jgi:hypothetical protein
MVQGKFGLRISAFDKTDSFYIILKILLLLMPMGLLLFLESEECHEQKDS